MKEKLTDELMNMVSGGTLPKGWEKMADSLAPMYMKQYPDVTYEEAVEILRSFVTDDEDFELLKEYMKKYF